MALRPPLYVANGSAGVTQPQDARLAQAGLLAGEPGVLVGAAATVTGSTSGPNMKYTIPAAVFATVRGTLSADGAYLLANDGAVTQDSGSPAPGSGSRYDLIWVRALNANDGFGDANSTPTFGVTVGTASGSPTKPYASVPAGALVLAESLVAAGIANASLATITQVWTSVVASGGVLPVPSSSGYPAGAFEGQYVDDAALDGPMRFNGTQWVPLDSARIVATGSLVVGSYDATKPLRRFFRRQNGTSDASGIITVTMPVTATGILWADGKIGTDETYYVAWRTDLTTSTSVQFRLRDRTTNTAQANTAYTLTAVVEYQS